MIRLAIPLALAASLAAGPAAAEAYRCSGPRLSFDLAFEDGTCRMNRKEGRLRAIEGARERRVSTPQMRIITFLGDAHFVYEDTDDDRVVEGACRPA